MSVKIKAVVLTKEERLSANIKDYLFRVGLRETLSTRDPGVISQLLLDDTWPLIFIDHLDKVSDAFDWYGRIYRTPGYELLTYIFVAPTDQKKYSIFANSAGGRAVISKPIVPGDAEKTIRSLVASHNATVIRAALTASKKIIKNEFSDAIRILEELTKNPGFHGPAEISLARCEFATGHISKAHERLYNLKESQGDRISILAELALFHRRKHQYVEALSYYKRIQEMHASMTIYTWEYVISLLEMDDLNTACTLIDSLSKDDFFRDAAYEGLARIMIAMGLQDAVPAILKPVPVVLKNFESWLFTTSQTRR